MDRKVDKTKAALLKPSEADDSGYVEGTPAERIAMVDQLTRNAWAFMGKKDAEPRLQRHIAKLIRKKR